MKSLKRKKIRERRVKEAKLQAREKAIKAKKKAGLLFKFATREYG